MKVLVACEESQEVCKAFREKGHEAYSCDMIPPSGGHPEWHILGDVLPILNGKCCFSDMKGGWHEVDKWDMIIAFPPCTYLTISGNRWFDISKYGKAAEERQRNRYQAIVFFMQMISANCERIAVENPVGIMNTAYRKPDQIIQPYEYGHPESKKTCIWLKNLPTLKPTNVLERPKNGWENQYLREDGTSEGFKNYDKNGKILAWNDPMSAKVRSKTYHGVATAMAEQWGKENLEEVEMMNILNGGD